MEIQHSSATSSKSNPPRNVNTVRWESRNTTPKTGEINNGKSNVIAFVVNTRMNSTLYFNLRRISTEALLDIHVYREYFFSNSWLLMMKYIAKIPRGIVSLCM